MLFQPPFAYCFDAVFIVVGWWRAGDLSRRAAEPWRRHRLLHAPGRSEDGACLCVRMGGGLITMGLRDENGHFLNGYVSGAKNYVVGEAGTRYTILLRNRSPFRFEVVLSVDGLDVLDGKDASLAKRGYVLDPRGELEVDGFRQSMDQVAAFRFGTVSSSYANQKHGETRNVGVIGVAVFHERGTDPSSWNSNEVDTRHNANPFPGTFATPP